ncbi:MAG: twin-arginine translocase TatA/TatE family subunit [Chloroflexi bacterium]|nr:twin-arginine translocase TatA/TatE family subunit [Chloroflexota bacterium]
MNFFDMGFGELLLVMIVILILFGPGKIPEIARTFGKMVNTVRKASQDLTVAVAREVEEAKRSQPDKPANAPPGEPAASAEPPATDTRPAARDRIEE